MNNNELMNEIIYSKSDEKQNYVNYFEKKEVRII